MSRGNSQFIPAQVLRTSTRFSWLKIYKWINEQADSFLLVNEGAFTLAVNDYNVGIWYNPIEDEADYITPFVRTDNDEDALLDKFRLYFPKMDAHKLLSDVNSLRILAIAIQKQ